MGLNTLLISACVLALIGAAQTVCCKASLTMSYTVANGSCQDAGGRRSGAGCTITICADGKAQVGTYCGIRSCNIFGCNCRDGCLRGNWRQSFLDRNARLRINITRQKWNSVD